jgi:hypothetical protein
VTMETETYWDGKKRLTRLPIELDEKSMCPRCLALINGQSELKNGTAQRSLNIRGVDRGVEFFFGDVLSCNS